MKRVSKWIAGRHKGEAEDKPNAARRLFFRGMAGAMLPGSFAVTQSDGVAGLATLPRAQLAVLLRDIGSSDMQADGALSSERQSMLDEITQIMPEAPDLVRLHRLYRSGEGLATCRPPVQIDLTGLHRACTDARRILLTYRDQAGAITQRSVRPIELVYPGRGIRLIAWCEMRQALRHFAVENMIEMTVLTDGFSADRHSLILAAISEKQRNDEEFYNRSA